MGKITHARQEKEKKIKKQRDRMGLNVHHCANNHTESYLIALTAITT